MSVRTAVVAAGYRPGLAERKMLGLSVLQRNILVASRAGAERIVVLCPPGEGPKVRRLAEAARRPGRRLHIDYHCAGSAEPPAFEEPFLFLEDGFVYHPEAVLDAMARGGGRPEVLADAADRIGFRRAERKLLQLARKPQDGFILRTVNRPISLFLTRRLLPLGMPPNLMSLIVLFVGLLSAWFVSRGTYAGFLLAGILFEAASVLDGCDGEIARLTYRTSRFGNLLDQLGDLSSYLAFVICLPRGVVLSTADPSYKVLGAAMLACLAGYFSVLAFAAGRLKLDHLVSVYTGIREEGKPGCGRGAVVRMGSRLAFIFRRDVFATAFCFILAVPGGAVFLLWLLTAVMPVQFLYVSVFTWRRYKRATAGGPGRPGLTSPRA